MPPRRVLVVSRHALFREGLRSILSSLPDAELLGAVSTLDEAQALARQAAPDVIVLNREEQGTEWESVADLSGATEARVVVVTLEDQGLTVYSRKRIPGASVEDLLGTLKADG